MKALLYYGPNEIMVKNINEEIPNDCEVMVEITAVGICGSDIQGYLGKTGRRIAPMVMGHECTGIVKKSNKWEIKD